MRNVAKAIGVNRRSPFRRTVEGQPRAEGAQADFSNDKARPDGTRVRIAGPIRALAV